jgi:uncharacterized lipoprotein YmbA
MRLRHWIGRALGLVRRNLSALLALTAALAIVGCAASDTTVTGSIPANHSQTIAFESIDGPPRPVFDRLVAALSAEAEQRDLPVVTHTGPSAYRVRAYLATYIERKKKRATVTWAWEVLDTRDNRAFRLTGEESLGKPQTDVWAQLDDSLLRRIAAKAFDELTARLGPISPTSPAPAGEPATAGPAVASIEMRQAAAFTNDR